LQDLSTSRFQICMRDAVVRCANYPQLMFAHRGSATQISLASETLISANTLQASSCYVNEIRVYHFYMGKFHIKKRVTFLYGRFPKI
jgi:hypothetical protein